MFLKSIEMHGFKSFPDKINLKFNRGLTAVVGPNGSGKSNVSDAIRWVLGEQSTKTLRGSKMEDVIFVGTQKRKSQGFAEVSLTIDNTERLLGVDDDLITITRKYYRSGDSEYLINNTNVRLKDINELFMDTGLGRDGYSMIGQGRIAEIVGAKSNERREIFEEAAGITKYRYRKIESERRLNQAEENLLRLRDIVLELEGRIEPLRIQSNKATKFLELSDQKKVMEISLWIDTLDHFKTALRDEENRLTICQTDHLRLEKEYDDIEKSLEDTFEEMQMCLSNMDTLRRQKEELEETTSQTLSTIAVLNNDKLHNHTNIDRINQEIEDAKLSDLDVKAKILGKDEDLQKTKNELEQIEVDLSKKTQQLLDLNSKSENFSSSVLELNASLNKFTLEKSQCEMLLSNFQQTQSELADRIAGIDQNLIHKQQEFQDVSKEQQLLSETWEQLKEKKSELENAKQGYQLKLTTRSEKLNLAKTDLEKIEFLIKEKMQKGKVLTDLDKSNEGFAFSVKSVLNFASQKQLSGVFGTISQLINVPPKYTQAIETALGGAISNIVVENEQNAKHAIKLLKDKNAGRATFLPLNIIKSSKLYEANIEKNEGFIGIASTLVDFDEKFDNVMQSLLGRIVIVEDLDFATIIAKQYGYKFKIVTLDGQVINAGGSFTGGSQGRTQGVLTRKNTIAELEEDVKKATKQKENLSEQFEMIKQEVDKLTAEMNATNSEIVVISGDEIRFESERKRIDHNLELLNQQLKTLGHDKQILTTKSQNDLSSKDQANIKLIAAEEEIAKILDQLNHTQGNFVSLKSVRDDLSKDLSNLSTSKTVALKDIEAINHTKLLLLDQSRNVDDLSNNLISQIQLLTAKNLEIDGGIAKLSEIVVQNETSVNDISREIEQIASQRETLKASTSTTRINLKQISQTRENLGRELAKLEERRLNIQKEYDNIIGRLWEDYQLTRSTAEEIAQEVESNAKLKSQLNEVKSKIKALGNINVEAIEEYKEVSQRYEFMSEQIADIEKAKSELLKLIGDLTAKMYDVFLESFIQINYHFNEIFQELFGGGRAQLILTEPDNVLESGIEIKVEPPGKIIKNLSSLSGGEQAFIAIAIYFAILKIRPAPFCVLDEIEAALDDVNVNKYAAYLQKMSDNTQFILITHRRGTMEAADVLYGVTMQEEGVSKLLELNVSELESQLIGEK